MGHSFLITAEIRGEVMKVSRNKKTTALKTEIDRLVHSKAEPVQAVLKKIATSSWVIDESKEHHLLLTFELITGRHKGKEFTFSINMDSEGLIHSTAEILMKREIKNFKRFGVDLMIGKTAWIKMTYDRKYRHFVLLDMHHTHWLLDHSK